jgi:hypothetical protein
MNDYPRDEYFGETSTLSKPTKQRELAVEISASNINDDVFAIYVPHPPIIETRLLIHVQVEIRLLLRTGIRQ